MKNKLIGFFLGLLMMFLIVCSGIFLATIVHSKTYNYQITRVIDGDTVEIHAPFIPDPLEKKLSVRIIEIDTPESAHRAKCPKERALAKEAKAFTEDQINKAVNIQINFLKWDKYGGRILGHIVLDGESLALKLIGKGLAVPYTGRGAKKDWCQ